MSIVNYRKHHCPIAQALAELGDRWTLLIVRDALLLGPRRFSDLQKSLGISRNLLTRRLAQLCDAGILDRAPMEGSRRHTYLPTQKCRDLRIALLAMAEWGEKWGTDPNTHRLEVLEKSTGGPVAIEFVQTVGGRVVERHDIEVVRHGNPREPAPPHARMAAIRNAR